MFNWLLEQDFMPHGHCYFWRPDVLWMSVISDAVIALAYFSIPVTLLYFLRRRGGIPFPGMIALFAAFILLCGIGHILSIWTVWTPVYPLKAAENALTAVASLLTALAMIPIVPQVLAMRTVAEVEKEKLKAVDELMVTQALLVQNEKLASLGALVAGISHEINTPVGIGVTAASTLQERTQTLKHLYDSGALTRSDMEGFVMVVDESSRLILNNLQRAANLIQGFKQVSVDQSSNERRSFMLKAYVEEVLMSLGPKLKQAHHKIDVLCPADLTVDSYPGAVAQIVTNFITNSLLHAYDEGAVGRLQFDISQRDGWVTFVYRDDGRGIPAEHLGRIFDPFFTTRRGSGGSGLGLHVVFTLVTQMLDGRIRVKSEPGRGVEFEIGFPVTAPASKAAT